MIVLRIVIPSGSGPSGRGRFVDGRFVAGPAADPAPTDTALKPGTGPTAATPPPGPRCTATSLQDVLRSRWLINVAVGMLAMRRDLTAVEARAHLSVLAARTGLHPADVANVIIADHTPDSPRRIP